MRTVLILGANGFIGSHLTTRLLREPAQESKRQEQDWQVIGVDLASHRLGHLASEERFSFVEADIVQSFEVVEKLIARADVVLPLVAIATPMCYVQDPLSVFELTFEANLRVVRACVELDRRVVFASSSEVYGMCDDEDFRETESSLVMGPIAKHRWIYACSKQLLDRVIHAYGLQHDLRYTIFRPFNWIGPGLDDPYDAREGSSRVLTQFIGNVLRGEDIPLVDGGAQRRCFLYVDDAVECLVRILENPGDRADRQIFNIGDPGAEISIRELANAVLMLGREHPAVAHLAQKVQCVDVPAESYYGKGYQDMGHRRPCIDAARDRLGWKPTTPLAEALKKTVDVYFGAERPATQETEIEVLAPSPAAERYA